VPRFRVRSPQAVAHALRAPGQLGIGRAYGSGQLEVDDIDAAIRLLDTWERPPLRLADRARLALSAARACGVGPLPSPPLMELPPRGRRHSRERDARAVRHHYDLPAVFFALFLDRSMTYSCAIFSRGAQTLEEAQETKLELVCTKPRTGPASTRRRLWLGQLRRPRREPASSPCHGHHAVGPSGGRGARARPGGRSRPAHRHTRHGLPTARRRALRRDREHRHGRARGRGQHRPLRPSTRRPAPAGRAPAQPRHRATAARRPRGRTVLPTLRVPRRRPSPSITRDRGLEGAGLETTHVEGFRHDYAETLRHWARRLDDSLEQSIKLAGPERVRVWRRYLRAARNGFETGFTSVYQALCTRR
jgi:cyclopropane-fatty-acyl-phospholipid synthase